MIEPTTAKENGLVKEKNTEAAECYSKAIELEQLLLE